MKPNFAAAPATDTAHEGRLEDRTFVVESNLIGGRNTKICWKTIAIQGEGRRSHARIKSSYREHSFVKHHEFQVRIERMNQSSLVWSAHQSINIGHPGISTCSIVEGF